MLLDYPIQTFSECSEIDRLIIVVPENYCSVIQKEYPDHSVISGSSSRNESAFKGLLACPPETEKVLIHDAARALVDIATIIRCINGLDEAKAISTVIPTKDTVVETNENIIVKMPNRSRMYLEQTPQGFHYQTILKAHTNIQVDTTDDIRLVNEMGIKCATVEGSENNFKITTKQDFQLAELLLREGT
jgi:2-C-methyl-D-erythritol 4-phosphate cytidylyltransferase